ncbi:hypothetical protein PCANC_06534 [Puccinia coronata f. sp. avenae]|uniref:Uncharacterized protein n=1 Tax=Puccinia coronata f. sp. avenae TaxID=200324 RepID=A0A2N5VAI7_9BASI|nr:hypothetical protein PCASD_22354 [Puccinia coronata f. sp. avenae]PLW47003.1 hypothetical protein PCANC_06534 [Puccinia coronata f. sp. avenae]PLW47208.1 hypothetical protein PCASD_02347 [Puccinia coronata f. sp. avenae]
MARIFNHPFELDLSIVSHRPPRFSDSVPPATTTAASFPTFDRSSNSLHRPPLLSIPQVQSTALSTTGSSQSPPSSTSDYSPKLNKPLTPTREKRRKLRSNRAGSPVLPASLSSNPSSLRFKNNSFRQARAHQPSEPQSDDNEESKILLPLQRLNLKASIPPLLPPAIPQDFMIAPSQCSYAHHTSIVEPSYTTPRDTPQDTYTSIRTASNSSSVSISTQPPIRFSRTMTRFNRLQRASIPIGQDSPTSSLDAKKSEEQDKWWQWARLCKVTGDGNKSSHLPPLRCRDLKRNFNEYDNDDHQDQDLRIQTKPLSESALEQQKFYYSG